MRLCPPTAPGGFDDPEAVCGLGSKVCGKLRFDLVADFKGAATDTGTDCCDQFFGTAKPHRSDRRRQDSGDHAAPPGMNCGDEPSICRSKQDRGAVGHPNTYQGPRVIADDRVGFGRGVWTRQRVARPHNNHRWAVDLMHLD